MLLSVLGAVAGTLASGALKEPSLRLVAAAVGAAIPPFVSVVGPFTRLRAATGVVVAALALLLTYTGTTLSDAVQGRGTTTFPVPRQVVEALGSGFTTQGDGTDTSDPLATCDVDPCFILSTDSVSCSITGCTPDVVVVRNSGRAPLTVAVEIVGADGGLFRSEDGCTGGTALAEGEECVLRITYVPGAALAHATLTIHQDPTGPAMSVELRGEPSTPNPSPTST